jgi:glutamyl-tRNA reductase
MSEENWSGKPDESRERDQGEAGPTIAALGAWADGIRAGELVRAERRLRGLTGTERAIVDAVTRRLVSALLREPTDRLKAAAAGPEGARYAEAVRHLFALDTKAAIDRGTHEQR